MKISKMLLICYIATSGCRPEAGETLLENGTWIDLTHVFSDETLFWPTSDVFQHDTVSVGYTENGYYYESFNFSTSEHGGTHLDAPRHFAEGMSRVHEVGLEQLTGYAVVIDVTYQVECDRNYRITTQDITEWENNYGEIPERGMVLFYTGLSQYWPDADRYLGTDKRGEDGVAELSFPGLHHEAAEWLVQNRNIKAVGLDTPSIDYGQSTEFRTHIALMMRDVPAFENVANLDQLPPTGAYVVAFPMKIRAGSGAPLRIAALVNSL